MSIHDYQAHAALLHSPQITEPFDTILQTLLTALEARELQLRRRAEHVADLSVRIGREMGLDDETLHILYCGALVHDIGNIGIPDTILLKPTGLNEWEFREIKQHPLIGEKIVSPLQCFAPIVPLVRSHHEKIDGSGYPDGLRGEQIPQLVRILSVADVYHTLRSVRAYRASFNHEQAMDILEKEVERGWWDAHIVSILKTLPQPDEESFEML